MELRLNSYRRHVLLFFQIVWFEAQRFLHYPLDFFVSFLSRFAGITQILIFWYVVSEFSGGALDTKSLLGYFLVAGGLQIIIGSGSSASQLIHKIKDGSISSSLVKPINTFFLEYTRNVGWLAQFYIAAFVMIFGGIGLVGKGVNAWVVVITVFDGLMINVALNKLIGSIAFYIVEARGVKNVIFHIWGLLQGYLIPLYLMPLLRCQPVRLLFRPVEPSQVGLLTGNVRAAQQLL